MARIMRGERANFPPMRSSPLFLLLSICAGVARGQGAVPIDTGAVVANIDQYMMLVDRSPIMASYARMTPDGPAEPVERGSAMPPGCVEFIELMVDSMHRVTGAVSYKPERVHGVKEATYHYFDAQHNTVAVRHELKWLNNHCTFSYAVRNDFQYFFPPRSTILEYTTLTDVEGNNLEPTTCVFPDIKRVPEVYYHVDAFLLMERVRMQ
jgi:hypothetical protein